MTKEEFKERFERAKEELQSTHCGSISLQDIIDSKPYQAVQFIYKKLRETIEYIINDKSGDFKLSDEKADTIAEILLPEILSYFETEEGKKEYEEWLKVYEQNHQKQKNPENIAI